KDRPDSAEAWLLLGQRLREAGQYPAAERVLEQHAVRLAPEKVEAWFNLGFTKFVLERWPEAAECFRKAIRFKPDHSLAHYNLGQCHLKLGDRAAAAEEFRLALQCRPDLTQAREALRELNPTQTRSP